MPDDPPHPAEPNVGGAGAAARERAGGGGEAVPGLASERTSLAWTRTVLAVIVAGALLLRSGAGLGGLWEVPGAVTIACGLLLLVTSLRRERRAASPALLRMIGVGVTLLCLASLVLTAVEV